MGNICHAGPVLRDDAAPTDYGHAPTAAPRRWLTFGRDPTLKREDYIFSGARGPSSLLKLPGSIDGQQFIIDNCSDCDIFLLDHCAAVQIDECVNCRIVIGPCESSLFLRNCTNCTVVCAVQQFRARDCETVDVYLYSSTEPIIESSKKMRFACFPLSYFSLQHQFDRAGFSVWNNRWSEIYNFTPDHGTWKSLRSSSHESPLTEVVERRENDAISLWRLPCWTGEELGLTIDARQLVVPLSCGMSVRDENEKRLLVVFPTPHSQLMLEFVHAMTNCTEYPDEQPVLLIRTRQLKLCTTQAKALFPQNEPAAQKAIQAAKDAAGSVVMEFQSPFGDARVVTVLQTARFVADPVMASIVIYADQQAQYHFPYLVLYNACAKSVTKQGAPQGRQTRMPIDPESRSPARAQTPAKRSHADESGSAAKRTRRSRWESGDDGAEEAAAPSEPAAAATSPSAKGALSEIVKRLSSVVKENKAVAPAGADAAPSGSPVDAAAARARALAQASLIAMGVPVGQVSPVDLAKRVYVGNLYYDLKEDDVRSFFGPFGTIRSIDLSMEPGLARSKGFCFIEYEDVLAAESAVQVLNGAQLSNRSLKVGRPHRGNSTDPNSAQNIGKEAIKNVPTKCVYVGCVRIELNSHHLQSIFSPFGEVRACVMAAVSALESTMHRGYGFLEFADEASASNAIQHMNDFELAGQKLKVGKASPTAVLINLAISQDKVVAGALTSTAALASPSPIASRAAKPVVVVEDPDVDAIAEVSPLDERRCLCLLNMVSYGQVDDELQHEVRDECSRFGAVTEVRVRELDDHVRVFVAFAAPKSALKAQKAMHGRFFAGNQVRALFYPLEELTQQRYRSAFL